jgi:hypothetical protein
MDHFTKSRRLVRARNVYKSRAGLPRINNSAIVADSQLGARGNPKPNILSRALHGQASTAVLTWENQSTMVNDWITPANWTNGKLDAILVSMGGDDIVGDQLAIYLTYGGGGKNGKRPVTRGAGFS